MHSKIDAKGMTHVRTYLRQHPPTDSPALFVTDVGKPPDVLGRASDLAAHPEALRRQTPG